MYWEFKDAAVGGNEQVRSDVIWRIAERNNKKPRKVIKRKVKECERVGVI